MPKSWEIHKAELVRLYITEGRTLKEVQSILRRRHGFKASTRAYRMKIDEWDLRKYKSSTGRTILERALSQPEIRGDDSSPPFLSLARLNTSDGVRSDVHEISTAAGSVDLSELLRRTEEIGRPYAYTVSMESLLSTWQTDGKHMKTCLDLLQKMKFCARMTDSPKLFVLLERHVPLEERIPLMKAFLDADLDFFLNESHTADGSIPFWVRCWRLAAEQTDWDGVKLSLLHPDLKGQFSKQTRDHCFLVILAERLLGDTKARLEHWRAQAEPLISADLESAEHCRWQYIRILKEFYNTHAQLNPIHYKYAIQVRDWDLRLAKDTQESQQEQIEVLTKQRTRYLQLISVLTNQPVGEIDDSSDFLPQNVL